MPIQVFSTYEEARDFAVNYYREYNLSYVPENIKKGMIHNALGYVTFDLLFKKLDYASSSIMNAMNAFVGERLLQYLEYKAKNSQEQEIKKAQEYQMLIE